MFAKQTFGAHPRHLERQGPRRLAHLLPVRRRSRTRSGSSSPAPRRRSRSAPGSPPSWSGCTATLPSADSTFRYNYGFVETTGTGTCQVKVTVKDPTGAPLGNKTYTVRQWEQTAEGVQGRVPGALHPERPADRRGDLRDRQGDRLRLLGGERLPGPGDVRDGVPGRAAGGERTGGGHHRRDRRRGADRWRDLRHRDARRRRRGRDRGRRQHGGDCRQRGDEREDRGPGGRHGGSRQRIGHDRQALPVRRRQRQGAQAQRHGGGVGRRPGRRAHAAVPAESTRATWHRARSTRSPSGRAAGPRSRARRSGAGHEHLGDGTSLEGRGRGPSADATGQPGVNGTGDVRPEHRVGVYGKHRPTGNYGYLGNSTQGVFGHNANGSEGYIAGQKGVYGYSVNSYGVEAKSANVAGSTPRARPRASRAYAHGALQRHRVRRPWLDHRRERHRRARLHQQLRRAGIYGQRAGTGRMPATSRVTSRSTGPLTTPPA